MQMVATTKLLDPYVAAQRLGFVYRPRAVLRREGSEVEPDLMVRQPQSDRDADWDKAPLPLLVVEILSDSTRRRDRQHKRDFYMDVGVAEYWIVDPVGRTITAIARGRDDVVATDRITWSPAGAAVALTVEVADVFG
jgi:Uma2 family endonuclease